MARQYYLTMVIPNKVDKEEQSVNQVVDIKPQEMINSNKISNCLPVGETIIIEVIPGHPEKKTSIGKDLPNYLKRAITDLIHEYSDFFAWTPNDMPGIPESAAPHTLHVNPSARPVCQKKRQFSEEKRLAIDEEINRLLKEKFIELVKFPTRSPMLFL